MNHPRRRQSDISLSSFADILMFGELHLSAVLLGGGMIMWGLIGMIFRMDDLDRFALDFMLHAPIFWGVHSIVGGCVFIWLAVKDFPSTCSLFFGMYGAVIYTWIAMARPVASITSGVTLNAIVILMSCLVVQRSGRK